MRNATSSRARSSTVHAVRHASATVHSSAAEMPPSSCSTRSRRSASTWAVVSSAAMKMPPTPCPTRIGL